MSASPVSLKGHHHTCPMVEPGPKPHVGGPVSDPGQDFVTVDGIPVAVVGGTCICQAGPPDPIAGGSSMLSVDGKPVARVGDPTGHGGRIVEGVNWFTAD